MSAPSPSSVHEVVRERIKLMLEACHYWGFCCEQVDKIKVCSIRVAGVEQVEKDEDELIPSRNAECSVEVEIVGDEKMCSMSGNVHGGCIAWLIDMCTALPTVACASEGRWATSGVSMSIEVHYLAAIPMGTKFRLISSIMRMGRSTAWLECRIVDASGKLLAFGVHTKQDVPTVGLLKNSRL